MALNRQRLLFPCLSMLDVSNNQLQTVPAIIAELTALSVLNLSSNPGECNSLIMVPAIVVTVC